MTPRPGFNALRARGAGRRRRVLEPRRTRVARRVVVPPGDGRVAGGESLYRDVAYGATPLAVYLTLPFVWLFGAAGPLGEGARHRLLRCARSSCSCRSDAGSARRTSSSPPRAPRCSSGRRRTAPRSTSRSRRCCSSPVLAAMLAWRDSGSTRTLALAGALAGLTFAAKQNVGVYARSRAPLRGAPRRRGRASPRRALVAAGSFAAPVGAHARSRCAQPAASAGCGTTASEQGASSSTAARSRTRTGSRASSAVVTDSRPVAGSPTRPPRRCGPTNSRLRPRRRSSSLRSPRLAAHARGGSDADCRGRRVLGRGRCRGAIPARTWRMSPSSSRVVVGALCAARMLVSEAHLRTAAVVLLVLLAPAALARGSGPGRAARSGHDEFSELPHARGVAIEPAVETDTRAHRGGAAARAGPGLPRHVRGRDPLPRLRRRERDAVRLPAGDDLRSRRRGAASPRTSSVAGSRPSAPTSRPRPTSCPATRRGDLTARSRRRRIWESAGCTGDPELAFAASRPDRYRIRLVASPRRLLRWAAPVAYVAVLSVVIYLDGVPVSRERLLVWILLGLFAVSIANLRGWARGVLLEWLPLARDPLALRPVCAAPPTGSSSPRT